MSDRAIRAFHYTRLTDDEVEIFLRRDTELSTPLTLRVRLDAQVAAGHPGTIGRPAIPAKPFQQRSVGGALKQVLDGLTPDPDR